ncbi:MAG: hypothetical protein JSS45_10705 [Proteobacteria bacterium]|nr:hypothetical protein [Pseudomonadota bacterium]
MTERKNRRLRRARIIGELRVQVAAVAACGVALLELAEAQRIRHWLALLARMLKSEGPFRIGRFLEIEPGVLSVPVRDISELQDATFDPDKLVDLARHIDERHRTGARVKPTDAPGNSDSRPEGADAKNADTEIEIICKMIDEGGGVTLLSPTGRPVQMGPERPPRRIRGHSPNPDMQMDVACRREMRLLITNKGSYVVRRDRSIGVKVGDAVEIVEEADGGLIQCVRARAAVKADSQLSLKLLS